MERPKMAESRGMEQVCSSVSMPFGPGPRSMLGNSDHILLTYGRWTSPLFPAISHPVNKIKENLSPSQHSCTEEEAKQLYSSLLHC